MSKKEMLLLLLLSLLSLLLFLQYLGLCSEASPAYRMKEQSFFSLIQCSFDRLMEIFILLLTS